MNHEESKFSQTKMPSPHKKREEFQIVITWIPYVILGLFAVSLLLFQGYLFYFAPCRKVIKEYWYLSHIPGRCISLPTSQ